MERKDYNMKIAVRYYTRSEQGNTKKLAMAIAKAVGVEALDLSHPVDPDTNILFLGSSVYAADIDQEVKKFIDQLSIPSGTIYNFSTAAIINSTYGYVKKYVQNKELKLSDQEFHCRGQFLMMHKNKPDENDLKAAAAFAKKIVEEH